MQSGSSAADEGEGLPEHFDHLIDAAPDAPGGSMVGSVTSVPSTEAVIDKEGFQSLFVGSFEFAHHFTGYQSLKVAKADARAKNCADALYETILDVPQLHFLIKPQSKWYGRAAAIGMFTIPMAIAVRNEHFARRHAAAQAPQKGQAEQHWPQQQPDENTPSAEQAAALNGGM